MKKQTISAVVSTSLICLGAASSVNAALIGRLVATPGGTDFQAYYDNVANLTWLADANYAATSGYAAANANGGINSAPTNIQANGQMGWQAANDWAAGLNVAGVTGWRLAYTLQPDSSCGSQSNGWSYGFNCTGSEMGNLFYNVLGNTAGSLNNMGPFSNVQADGYWSATEYAPLGGFAWGFSMGDGNQNAGNQDYSFYGWAVQSGDVGTVPLPAAVWLFGFGLLGLAGVSRQSKLLPG